MNHRMGSLKSTSNPENIRGRLANQLSADAKKRAKMPRELSNHVVSRFYRPPEIILLENVYN